MTDLLYLQAFDVLTCQAKVLASSSAEDGKKDIILNATCFYPRGGGQDWDTGHITAGATDFIVHEVRLDETGIVHHIGDYQSGTFAVGDDVACTVDATRRTVNTRLHSAGHVIDMAIDSLGLDWVATKGQHYPGLSAVEYSGTWEPEKADELRAAIEARAKDFIHQNLENNIRFMPVNEMHTVCRHVPANIPANKPARVVMYGSGFGIPCGGTHVKTLGTIGDLNVTKLKAKKGVIRVTYALADIA